MQKISMMAFIYLTHFSLVLHFIYNLAIWFAVQIKWMVSICKHNTGLNRLKIKMNPNSMYSKYFIYHSEYEIMINNNSLHLSINNRPSIDFQFSLH